MPVCLSFCVRVCLSGRPEIWDWRPAPFYNFLSALSRILFLRGDIIGRYDNDQKRLEFFLRSITLKMRNWGVPSH